jgi:GH3 auxin-responsive promoter
VAPPYSGSSVTEQLGASVATAAWLASALPAYRLFSRALADPERAQERVLRRLLAIGALSAFGRAHALHRVRTAQDFGSAVPLGTWDDHAPWVHSAASGAPDVLTSGTVDRFEPTSGTTTGRKLIPSTAASRRELSRAVGAWVVDTYGRDPRLIDGRAYWSISPALPAERTAAGIPIGFADDAGYLGGFAARLVRAALVQVPTGGDFWEQTAQAMLAAPDLRLISVWNPSFAALLLDAVQARGRTAAEAWPGLRLWSAWADGASADEVPAVQARLPGVTFQPKGLLATEGVVSIPFAGTHPLAITSHYLELASDDGAVRPLWSARPGEQGEVVLTTGAGLWRYRLRDRVEVTGHLGATPTIRFLGRGDRTVDLQGEKLTEAFVGQVVERLGVTGFAMLAPEGRGYVLYAEAPVSAEALEAELRENPHYAWCVELGQLAPAAVVRVPAGAGRRYVLAWGARGRRLGDVKAPRLETIGGWGPLLAPPDGG